MVDPIDDGSGHGARSANGAADGAAEVELGFSAVQVAALEQVAYDELAAAGPVRAAPLVVPQAGEPAPCARAR